jgi:hypothetical protein
MSRLEQYEYATADRQVDADLLRRIIHRKQGLAANLDEAESRAASLPYSIRAAALRAVRIEGDLLAAEDCAIQTMLDQALENVAAGWPARIDAGQVETRVASSLAPSYPSVSVVTADAPLGDDVDVGDMVVAGLVAPLADECLLQADARTGQPCTVERYQPRTFDRCLAQLAAGRENCLCLLNHNLDTVLGNTRSGTLRLSMTSEGLAYRVSLDPQNPFHVAAYRSVRRRDIAGASCGFLCRQDRLYRDPERQAVVRELQDADLIDVSLCPRPGYPRSTAQVVAQRSRRSYPAAVAPVRPQEPLPESRALPGSVRAVYEAEKRSRAGQPASQLQAAIDALARSVGL